MEGSFNPAALHSLEASLGDGGVVVEVDEYELQRISGATARNNCAALRLAGAIIGMATATGAGLEDKGVIECMGAVLGRLDDLRREALAVVGAEQASPDFPAIFNATTTAMLSVVTEEWRWKRLIPGRPVELGTGAISKLLEEVKRVYPERYERQEGVGFDLAMVRWLAVMEAQPKIYALVNLFDYYQANALAMPSRLMRAVAEQAELYIAAFGASIEIESGQRALIKCMYALSVGLMCETYKTEAARDVGRLREMPDLDRGVMLAQYEHSGGLSYDHVIEAHRKAMVRASDTANAILQSQEKS